MTRDLRVDAARYYDLNPEAPSDIAFYTALISSAQATVLELGCGTGRVLVPLAGHCGFIQGIDSSDAMLAMCRDKLRLAGIPISRAQVTLADISEFDLGRTFDLIIAPYRVVQNLEADSQLDGLFRCVHAHLAPGGSCVLNVFMPKRSPEELRQIWVTDEPTFRWEVAFEGGRVRCDERRGRLDPERLILYPELIWRHYQRGELVDEAVLTVPMRCYYPDQFTETIVGHGFRVVARWGGYMGEEYGWGPELLVQFERAA